MVIQNRTNIAGPKYSTRQIRSEQQTLPSDQVTLSGGDNDGSTRDKVAQGALLVSVGGLATSLATFSAMEAGLIARGSGLEMAGGLGGVAAFALGAVVGVAATWGND